MSGESCWCERPATCVVTVDPLVSPASHTITHRGWAGHPASPRCDQHIGSGTPFSFGDAQRSTTEWWVEA